VVVVASQLAMAVNRNGIRPCLTGPLLHGLALRASMVISFSFHSWTDT
jgi:hypothetical protein